MTGGGPLVTVFVRADCPLCDEALTAVQRLAPKLRFAVRAVDIESDADLHRRYLFEVPVIAVGEREVARAPIDYRRLEEDLAAALAER